MAKKILVSTMPFEFSPEQISESIDKNSKRLIVRGILQKHPSKIKMVEFTHDLC